MTYDHKSLNRVIDDYNLSFSIYDFAKEYENNKKLQQAYSLYKQKNYESAFLLFEEMAFNDNHMAQYQIAYMYLHGEYVDQDSSKALHWYQQSANNGNVHAQIHLGVMYANGFMGLSLDYKLAEYWYKKALESNYKLAYYFLGILFMLEDNLDIEKSLHYNKLAAEEDIPQAQEVLGLLYKDGMYIDKDIPKAIYWLKKAANKNLLSASYSLGLVYTELQDFESAKYWYEKAAEQEYVPAQNNLGILYKQVYGDYEKAIFWYTKAAEQNSAESQNNLAVMYCLGLGVDINFHKAAFWAKKAISNGYDASDLWNHFELWKYS